MTEPKQPNQPIIVDDCGTERFKANAIVRHLLHNGGIHLGQIAELPFSDDDRRQFHQLIGYSLCGFEELGFELPSREPQSDLTKQLETALMQCANVLAGVDMTKQSLINALEAARNALKKSAGEA